MKIKVHPGFASGNVRIPSSKSMSHRAIICAALANGKTIINNIIYSKDIKATIHAVVSMGAIVEEYDNYIIVTGIKDFSNQIVNKFNASESGSTLRFMIPIYLLFGKSFEIYGEKSLLKRPLNVYEDILQDSTSFAITDERILIQGTLKPGEYTIKGNVSSQFISGLLFALPLLDENSRITVVQPYESKSYVDLTVDVLRHFNIKIEQVSEFEYFVPGNQRYISNNYYVEGDYSQFAFFAALGAINGDINIYGMNKDSLQGDRVILDILKSMNANCVMEADYYNFKKSNLIATKINITNCPDLAPIIAVLGASSNGITEIINVERLKIKESNRVDSILDMLLNFDITTYLNEGTIFINGRYNVKAKTEIDPHNDHRILMASAVFSTIAQRPVIIKNMSCVEKSYPNFVDDLINLGIRVEILAD